MVTLYSKGMFLVLIVIITSLLQLFVGGSCLICICLHMLVSDTYCVFVLIFFVLFSNVY